MSDKFTAEATAEAMTCPYCGKRVQPGDRAVAYVDNDAAKTKNIIKMAVHEACAPAFFGAGGPGGVQ